MLVKWEPRGGSIEGGSRGTHDTTCQIKASTRGSTSMADSGLGLRGSGLGFRFSGLGFGI